MRNAFASLTARLVVTAVALVAVVVALIGVAATLALHSVLAKRLDEDVQTSLRQVPPPGARSFATPPTGDRDDEGPFSSYRAGSLTLYATRDWYQGVVFTKTGTQSLTRAQVAALTQVDTDQEPHDVSIPGLGEYRVAAASLQISLIGGTGTSGVVVVGLPTSTVDGPVSELLAWEAGFGLLGVAAAAGVGTYVVRRQLRPLRQVASTAHTVAAMPLAEGEIAIAPRVPDHLTDERTEVGQVGSALNTLLVHVESSLAQRHRSEQQVRQFVADASHELRTPLTTIAGYTELARRRPEPETVTTALAKVEEESARVTAMVEDLLLLARLDAGRPLARDAVDLSRLLVEAVSDARVVAPDHVWRLDLPEESLEVSGDAERLHQVVSNLLTNARKHTPAGTTVTVTGLHDGMHEGLHDGMHDGMHDGTGTGARYGFAVHDDGPGFPPGLADTAFERFARGDTARTRSPDSTGSTSGGGAGLGLALVDAIVTAHGGSVTLDTRPGSTTITVDLPE